MSRNARRHATAESMGMAQYCRVMDGAAVSTSTARRKTQQRILSERSSARETGKAAPEQHPAKEPNENVLNPVMEPQMNVLQPNTTLNRQQREGSAQQHQNIRNAKQDYSRTTDLTVGVKRPHNRDQGSKPSMERIKRAYYPTSIALRTRVEDIDGRQGESVQLVPRYAHITTSNMRSLEVRNCAADYIPAVQPNITTQMRTVLIDWLVEVADEFKLVSETLFLTISYIDRFLSARWISPQQLQLLGVTAMLIASKFEEIYPPGIDKFAEVTDLTCSVDAIATAEAQVLNALDYRLMTATPKVFLQRFLKAAHLPTAMELRYLEQLTRYILELALLDYQMLRWRASTVAAAALFLGRFLLAKTTPLAPNGIGRPHMLWTRTLEHYTFHQAHELEGCVRRHHANLVASEQHHCAVKSKYSAARRQFVGLMRFMHVRVPVEVFEQYYCVKVPIVTLPGQAGST